MLAIVRRVEGVARVDEDADVLLEVDGVGVEIGAGADQSAAVERGGDGEHHLGRPSRNVQGIDQHVAEVHAVTVLERHQ